MFDSLEVFVLNFVHTLPLELFLFIGSFIEEVIPPIPSPSIVVIAGSVAAIQQYTIHGLMLLILFASVGKTLGALVVYTVTKYAGDHLIRLFGNRFGITHEDIKRFSNRFTGGFRDYASLAILRSVPIIPSILLSFGSGVIGLPVRVFVVGTFIGTIVRDSFYIFVGYSGAATLKVFVEQTSHIESLVTFGVLVTGIIVFLYFIQRKIKQRRATHTPDMQK